MDAVRWWSGLPQVAGIDGLREPRLIPKAHTTDEADAIWREAQADGPRVTAAVALFLYAGLRRSEVQHLRWTDIEGDYIRFSAKGGTRTGGAVASGGHRGP